jgi:hypothetical protein
MKENGLTKSGGPVGEIGSLLLDPSSSLELPERHRHRLLKGDLLHGTAVFLSDRSELNVLHRGQVVIHQNTYGQPGASTVLGSAML